MDELLPYIQGKVLHGQADHPAGPDILLRHKIREKGDADALADEPADDIRAAGLQHRRDRGPHLRQALVHETAVAHALLRQEKWLACQILDEKGALCCGQRTGAPGHKMDAGPLLPDGDVLRSADALIQGENDVRLIVVNETEHLLRVCGNDFQRNTGEASPKQGKIFLQQGMAEGVRHGQADMALGLRLPADGAHKLLRHLEHLMGIAQHLPALIRQCHGTVDSLKELRIQLNFKLFYLKRNVLKL